MSQEVLQAFRSTMTSFDLGSSFLQTQSTITRNPVVWGRAMGAGLLSIAQEPLAFVAKNRDLIDRGIKQGAITPPSEFLFADRGLSSLPGRIPVVGQALKASNRFMQWNVFVAQTELYRAMEGNGSKSVDELVKFARQIRNQTGTESYAIKGIRPNQQMVETIAAFAPRFTRGLSNTIFAAFTPGPTGDEARRVMAGVIGGMTALTVAANYATTGKAPNYTDPYKEDWGRFKLGVSYVSAYGPFHSYFRALARMGYSMAHGQPLQATKAMLGFFNSKEGIALRAGRIGLNVVANTRTYNGEGQLIDASPQGMVNFMRDFAPITPANVATGVAKGQPESLLNIFNVNINPEMEKNKQGKYPDSSVHNKTPSYIQQSGKKKGNQYQGLNLPVAPAR